MICEYHILPLPGRQGHFSQAVRTEEDQPCRGAAALPAQTPAAPASPKGKGLTSAH